MSIQSFQNLLSFCILYTYSVYAMFEQLFTKAVPSDQPNYTFFEKYLSWGNFTMLKTCFSMYQKFNSLNFAETLPVFQYCKIWDKN